PCGPSSLFSSVDLQALVRQHPAGPCAAVADGQVLRHPHRAADSVQHVGAHVDAFRDFYEDQSFLSEHEHPQFGDVKHFLAHSARTPGRKRYLLHARDEFAPPVVTDDGAEHDLAYALRDFDEAAGTGNAVAELADIDIALGVDFAHP